MSSPKSTPWTPVHVNILLYLAWKHNGCYQDIERTWNHLAPNSKRSLRAITDRLQGIQKDVKKIGLEEYFEGGSAVRRKTDKPKGHGAMATLPAPQEPEATGNAIKTESDIDAQATPWISATDMAPATTIENPTKSAQKLKSGNAARPRSAEASNALKRKKLAKWANEDSVEEEEDLQSTSKKRKI